MTPRGDDAKSFILDAVEPGAVGLDRGMLDRLSRVIEAHIAEGRYPGAQIAMARHGKLAFARTFGQARIAPDAAPARDDTLWLLYSNTKVITACALWILAEEGALTFHDRVADHVPEFARHGKGDVTLLQLLTHQGGFPTAGMALPPSAFVDHDELRRLVCDFTLEWAPGTRVEYHRLAAHWVCGIIIEALTKKDYRDFIRERIIAPLGLGRELYVGLPDSEFGRAADMHQPAATKDAPGQHDGHEHSKMLGENTPEFRRAGIPGAGGYATARAMAAFYQMLANGGALGGVRIVSPRMVEYVTRNFTADRIDHFMGMPMHRGLGPHSRGLTPGIRGLGSIAHPGTFGHGGVGSSYSWADPATGVSFCYLSNSRVPDPWHSRRMDIVCSLAHAAIVELA